MKKNNLKTQVCLKSYNTMSIEAWSDNFIIPFSTEEIAETLRENNNDVIILGNGSNTIFQQRNYTKPIISTIGMNRIEYNNGSIIVESGVALYKLSWFALEHCITGFEFLEDIPGSIGGALYMNAGTYEDTIGDKVVSVTIYDYSDNHVKELPSTEIAAWWGKRKSYFQHHPCFIIRAIFDAGSTGDYEAILDRMLETKKKRYMKQPRNYPNAGSVFKRPYIDGEPRYIWKLFDEAGIRGYRIGDAQVSEKHPGFIVNVGNATGQDVVDLMNYCKRVVWEKYGIKIEEEWRIV